MEQVVSTEVQNHTASVDVGSTTDNNKKPSTEIIINNKLDAPKLSVVEKDIPAKNIGSGLINLEIQATQIIHRLENLKTFTESQTKSQQQLPNQITSPGFLNVERKWPSVILSNLETLIVNTHSDSEQSEEDDDQSEFIFPALDEITNLALISNSIVAYLGTLGRDHLAKIASNILTDTNRWLSHMFRFIDCSASYHNDTIECILRAVRLAIVSRCPGYLESGIQALAKPCLYISEQTSAVGLQYACRQLGLPLDSIRLVPCSTTPGVTQNAMDISTLQKMISSDIAANRTPLFVIADVGAAGCGSVDNIGRLQDICKASGVWLHCRGFSLAALALTQGAGDTGSIADSMSLQIGSWLGIPTLPVILLHRQIQNIALSIFETDPIKSRRLSSLSLWSTLQALGRETITKRIALAFESCRLVYEIISKIEGIRILSKVPATGLSDSNNVPSILDLINKPLNPNLLFETAISVVSFQFDGNFLVNCAAEDDNQSIVTKSLEKISNSTYFDKLNSWLGQILIRDHPQMLLEIIDHSIHGTYIRYCPFELTLGGSVPNLDHFNAFSDSLESQIEILKATILQKQTLKKLVEKSDVLRLVQLPDWPGLGGVRFVPEGWETILTDQAKTELNKLNTDLVEALRPTDGAFSLGEGADGLTCVRFGMVTEETDLEDLLELVVSVGRKVQENSKVLDTMMEIVKKGIETATLDLQRETEEKLWNEGILRHVPVVGSFVNWWSPPAKESGIKGRSLNLTQGVVESTENIYKYHMQIAGGTTPLPGNKNLPPTPMVQTSVSGHSRTVSQSSGTSTNLEGATSN